MTKEESEMVERYFDAGYIVLCKDTPLVDSEVKAMYRSENNDNIVLFDTDTFDEKELEQVPIWNVVIAKPILKVELDDRPIETAEPGYYEINNVNGEDM